MGNDEDNDEGNDEDDDQLIRTIHLGSEMPTATEPLHWLTSGIN